MSGGGRFVRLEHAVAISTEHELRVSMSGGVPTVVRGLDGKTGSRLWEALASTSTRAHLAEVSGLAPAALQVVLDALIEVGAVRPGRDIDPDAAESVSSGPDTRPCARMVLCVCGCAQAIFTPDLVRRLLSGLTRELDVVLTLSAGHLVSERALTTLGARVWTDPWQPRPDSAVPHIDLARSAQMVLVLPASARSLFSLGHATCDDLSTLVVTGTSAPVVIVPSMNPAMWTNKTVQDNVDRCRRAGMTVVEPGFARSVADGPHKRLVGGVGIGPSTPGTVSLLASLMEAGQGT